MFAAKRGHVDIVRTLLEASADVNAVGKVGYKTLQKPLIDVRLRLCVVCSTDWLRVRRAAVSGYE
jgi:ankyrin repeat protein